MATTTIGRQETESFPGTATATARNLARLKAVMSLFRLEQADVVKATGFSKAYISRLLHETGFKVSDRFWTALNLRLADLVQTKAVLVFEVTPTAYPLPPVCL